MTDSLAAAILQALTRQRVLAYAQVSPDGIITACSPHLSDVLEIHGNQVRGHLITTIFPELVGAEDQLLAVLHHQLPHYQIPYINHTQSDGSVRYLTVHVMAILPQGLLLLVEDCTNDGRLRQALEQIRNELHLLCRQIQEKSPCSSS